VLVGKIQSAYGASREQAKGQVDDFAEKIKKSSDTIKNTPVCGAFWDQLMQLGAYTL